MSSSSLEILEKYAYPIPESLIAHEPASPRDMARLFVYDTKTDTVSFSTFARVADFLPKDSLLVLNDTKVVPARVFTYREVDSEGEVLLSMNTWEGGERIKAISNRKLEVGEILFGPDKKPLLEVIGSDDKEFVFKLLISSKTLFKYLDTYGHSPLPPYIKSKNTEKDIRSKYQTVFAKQESSVAAPTASLHFTDSVFNSLSKKAIQQAIITLHIGLGTFAPITDVQINGKKLHTEMYSVPKKTAEDIFLAKKEGRSVIAVGTTVVRALESKSEQILSGTQIKNSETNIFIKNPYHFVIPDILITNFHVPKSSLLMLVDAFLLDKGAKRNIIDLYKIAIENKFRFYSFGDAMLIL